MTNSDTAFLRRTLIVLAVGVGAIAVWRLRHLELLLFAAILTAVFLRRLAQPVSRHTPLPDGLALGVVVVGFVIFLAVAGGFLGWRVQLQLSEAAELLPKAFRLFMQWVRSNPLADRVVSELQHLQASTAMPALMRLPAYAASAVFGVVDALAVLVAGIYLAAEPELYRGGLLRLLPAGARDWTAGTLDEAGTMLRKWLVGQLVAMASVGALTGVGLWIIGVPTPAALGLFAAVAEFVPVAGPIISAIPALLLALLQGWDKAAWTLLLFIIVQQFENHVLLPLVQHRFATLPPVVTLFAILGFTLLFGPLGVLVAVPMTVVVMVVIKRIRLG